MRLQEGTSAQAIHQVTSEVVAAFGNACGDLNPLHFDATFAATTRFGRPIAHGALIVSYWSALMGTHLPGPGTIYVTQHTEFRAPVYIGETVRVEVAVESVRPSGLTRLVTRAWVEERLVAEGYAVVLAPKSALSPASPS
jgi:3-hydroxybutyryl-CoA dehydratase